MKVAHRLQAVVLALLLSSTGALAQRAAPAPAPAGTPVQGAFTILRGDTDPALGGGTRTAYVLDTDQGETLELDLSGATLPEGGVHAMFGKRIEAIVDTPANGLRPYGAKTRVLSTRIVEERAPGAKSLEKYTGTRPYITIMCRFAGNAAEPNPPAYFQNQLLATYPGFDHYFRNVSYSTLSLAGSTAHTAWVSLPHPKSFYVDGVKSSSTYLTELWDHCTAAADAAGVNFAPYMGVNMMFNDRIDGSAWGGTRPKTLDGMNRSWSVTWMPHHADTNFGFRHHGVMAHELSHSQGAPHSSGPDGQPYTSLWDVVSSPGGTCGLVDTNYGCIGQNPHAMAKMFMGIMPAIRIATNNGVTASYNIERLSQPPNVSGTYLVVRANIAGNANRFYTIESRLRTGYDVQLPADGVIIHEVDLARDPPARLVTPGNANSGGAIAAWLPGMTFTNAADNVSVTVNSFSGTGTANVTVAQHIPVVDAWPPSCTMPAGWTMPAGATAGWTVDASSGLVGCSLKSLPLPTPPNTDLVTRYRAEIQYTGSFAAGNITFAARVSSEAGYECLRFTIDGAQQDIGACDGGGTWGGAGGLGLTPTYPDSETGWRNFVIPVTAGTHTLRWSYDKDAYTDGEDTAWIDSVVLPLAASSYALNVGKAGTGAGTVTSNPAGINCGATCSASYASGTMVTLTAAPGSGSVFAGWSGGGCSGTSTCTVTMTAARSVSATFNLVPTFALTVGKTGTGSGTVTSTPAGISCGADCSESYPSGTMVNLTPTPTAGSYFAGWSGACTGTGACSVTMSTARSVTANFAIVTAQPVVFPAQAIDFNGDGKADLAWRRTSDNLAGFWVMNGSMAPTYSAAYGPAAGAVVHLTGDFDGNGLTDLVWRAGGSYWHQPMNGLAPGAVTPIFTAVDQWEVIGKGDFDGNGTTDLLWRNGPGGLHGIWLMNGAAATKLALASPGAGWNVAAIGDFDGNGRSDLLWRKDGEARFELMNGATVVDSAVFAVPATWTVDHIGDFNGDGKADPVWRRSDGLHGVWLMDGKVQASAVAFFGPGNGPVVQVADFDGDGKSDLLWRGTNGSQHVSLMNGGTITSTTSIFVGDNNWGVIGHGDYDGDGKADLLWRASADNSYGTWIMNGAVPGTKTLIIAPGTAWQKVP